MNLIKSLAISVVLLSSQAASAAVYQLGDITPSSAVSFDTAVFDTSVDFIDYFTFNLTADAGSVFSSVMAGAPTSSRTGLLRDLFVR